MTQLGQNGQNPMKTYTAGYSHVPSSRNTEIDKHLEEIAKNLIVEHMFCTVSIATNNWTPVIFSTAWIVKRVWLLGTSEYGAQQKKPLATEISPKIYHCVCKLSWKSDQCGSTPPNRFIYSFILNFNERSAWRRQQGTHRNSYDDSRAPWRLRVTLCDDLRAWWP